MYMLDFKVITTDGQFDARKARQMIYEASRDDREVAQSHDLATHLGLNSEEMYLLMSLHLLAAKRGLMANIIEDLRTRIPTFRVQATQTGPFDTKPS
jgi:hypothetical protein